MPFDTIQLVAIGVSFALTLALTPLVRALARRVGMVAKPKIDRWHKKPTAMLGGVTIWLAVIITYLIFVRHTPYGWVVIGSSTFLFLVGLVDDILHANSPGCAVSHHSNHVITDQTRGCGQQPSAPAWGVRCARRSRSGSDACRWG